MKVRYVSHASIQIVTDSGLRLLTDPWLHSPIYGNMMWQFPVCTLSMADYTAQDILHVSHDHPDHFCARTLRHFDRSLPVVIRRYEGVIDIKGKLKELGFKNIIELGHRESWTDPRGLTVTLLIDAGSTDSATIISDGKQSVFNQNDCFLSEEDYR